MSTQRSLLLKRIAAAVLLTLFAIQVIPSIADVITGSPQENSEEVATPAPIASSPEEALATSTDSSSPSISDTPNPTASITYPNSETATPEPTYATTQDVKIRIPSKFPVDPRATSVNISPIAISGGEILLVCMSVDNAVLKLAGSNGDLLVEGDNSKNLRISGDGAAVNALLNAGRGIRLIATARINGAVITTRAASMTAPSVQVDFCAGAEKVSKSSISAMGLGLNTVKNPVGIR